MSGQLARVHSQSTESFLRRQFIRQTPSYPGAAPLRKMTALAVDTTPSLSVSALATFQYDIGGPPPPSQILKVTSDGTDVHFTAVATSTGWLTLPVTSAFTPAQLSVVPSQGGLGAGTYNGFITVNSPDILNGPITVNATLKVNPATAQKPDLAILSFKAPVAAAIGGSITGVVTVIQNVGTADAPPFRVEVFLAKASTVSASDIDTGWGCSAPQGLPAGGSITCTGDIGIPPGLAPGVYSLAAIADPSGVVNDANPSNNVRLNDNGQITLSSTASQGTCSMSLAARTASYDATGGSGTIAVTTGAGCAWTASTSAGWIHIAAPAAHSGPGTVSYKVDANSDDAVRTAAISAGDQTFTVSQAGRSHLPAITAVAEPWNYGPGLAPGVWVSIYGTDLAAGVESWAPVQGQALPTTLGGVTVRINGIPAPVSYVSPTLVNVLVPSTVPDGQSVTVTVTTAQGDGPSFNVFSARFLPALYSNPSADAKRFYVTAVDPVTGDFVGTSSADGRTARAARPGDTLDVFAVGLGPTTPQFPTDTLFSTPYTVSSPFLVVLGSTPILPQFAALIAPGLYQVRLTLPASMAAGDQPLWFDFGAIQSAQNVYLTIQP
jgi:uncharacterized protein (TIGR03437 family)